ncbi:MAG: hypothetical protein KAU14_04750 [Thermoplasmata archaeon]|nr:hypothetical protein [Thermoplasmata archaeon]
MSELITLDIFKKAITNSMKTPALQEQAAAGLAEHVLNFFGFQDRIIDNMLDPHDRDAFYMLEDVGLLTTEREETGLPDGREWRIHYWVMREDRILKALKMRKKMEKKDERSGETIYDKIPDYVWFRRTTVADEEEEEEEEEEIDETEWETPELPESIVPVVNIDEEEKLEGEGETSFVNEKENIKESEEEPE